MGSAIKVGVIGVGYLGRHHARLYAELPAATLVGVADVDEGRARDVAASTGARAFTDYRELLSQVDAVSVVVPTSLHHRVAMDCLDAGLDVLLEKPMTVTLAEADELIARAEAKRRIIQIGHLERFNGAVRALAPRLTAPRFIESHRLGPFVGRGTDVHVILDLMIHDLDIILSLVRSPLTDIRAVGVAVLTPHIDIANTRLEFADGCVANVTASRVSKDALRKLRIFQPDAYFSLDYQKQEVIMARRVDGATEAGLPAIDIQTLPIEKEEPLKAQLSAFLDSVATRRAPLVSGREGRSALRVALDVLTCIEGGGPVRRSPSGET
ncbi:MAG: Gfo/Idh/MocA family oxidoreductase [Nitrospirae bacterium]|nr:Gfo/Idh/MocA family oxidoreductase [Nitrospirota bacterium]